MDKQLNRYSRQITKVLRHTAIYRGLCMREDAYVSVDELLNNLKLKNKLSIDQLQLIVKNDNKQRLSLCEINNKLYIRANQGHSIKNIIHSNKLLTKIIDHTEVPVCVHGTYLEAWESIKFEGLYCMNRNHIHFATGLPKSSNVISGMRNSSQVLIYIDVEYAMNDGIVFFKSDNNVILSSGVNGIIKPKYFKEVVLV